MEPSHLVQSGDVELAVYLWSKPGTKAKPKATVVLVHGYPDAASVWDATAAQLAERYFVVTYDVRGAGRSSIPNRTEDYELTDLMNDLSAVLNDVSPHQPVHLVCHDWGSIQCWEAVTTEHMADRIASYTSISGPCLDHAGHWIRNRLRSGSLAPIAKQVASSWYIMLFQLPVLGPAAWKLGLDKRWPRVLEKAEGISGVPPSVTQRKDGSNGVNLYRANFVQRLLRPRMRRTEIPVQVIMPRYDRFMMPDILNDLPQWAPNLWRRDVEAGHWMPLSHPELLAACASEFVDFVETGKESAALKRARVRDTAAA